MGGPLGRIYCLGTYVFAILEISTHFSSCNYFYNKSISKISNNSRDLTLHYEISLKSLSKVSQQISFPAGFQEPTLAKNKCGNLKGSNQQTNWITNNLYGLIKVISSVFWKIRPLTVFTIARNFADVVFFKIIIFILIAKKIFIRKG